MLSRTRLIPISFLSNKEAKYQLGVAKYLGHLNMTSGEGNGIHSSVLAWRIPGTTEPGGLPSMGSHRVGHD